MGKQKKGVSKQGRTFEPTYIELETEDDEIGLQDVLRVALAANCLDQNAQRVASQMLDWFDAAATRKQVVGVDALPAAFRRIELILETEAEVAEFRELVTAASTNGLPPAVAAMARAILRGLDEQGGCQRS